ncbi:PKD domain-containing protein [Maribellus sp. YY47]|uniref:PKD domain-containing protein n=1 Tax=Maribellus sp. YY47 TaxID=2929486 RepID=UPI0020015E0B|nr:PKD domain-containing protein [Maribellus sp. YY47]MCK3685232.1 PKD domain-containing protein [Maribellus sp. YY47]
MKKLNFRIWALLVLATAFFTACTDDDDPKDVKACFTFSPEENIRVGDTVYFSNCSQEATEYAWNFGGSETSSEAEPFHVFTEPGSYEVSLVATNGSLQNKATSTIEVTADLAFIINAGSWSGDKSTITAYNKYADEVINGYYKSANGLDIVSNIQFAYHYNGNIYFMGNEVDEVFYVNENTFVQTKNSINENIVSPRYCQGKGNYLYVSCWGGSVWADQSVSYIAKVNVTTNTVEKKIPMAGGPEGLAIANNKLYAALNYKDSVAVMDLTTEAISYIALPAGNTPSYFEKDNHDNLYLNLGRRLSDYTTQTGLGYINTTTDQIEATFSLDGVSSTSYVDVMAFNADFSKIYVMTSGFDANWNVSGSVAVFDVATKTFDASNLVEGISGINGVGFYDDKVMYFVAPSVTGNGKMVAYREDGTKLKEYGTGIAPFMILSAE